MESSSVKELLRSREFSEVFCVRGWIRTRRDSKGGFSFLEINDGSCLTNLQVVVDADLPNYESDVLRLHPGGSVEIHGRLNESPGQGQPVELKAERVIVHGFCDVTAYPLQKQRVSFERLREVAHLRARTNTFGAVTRVRNALSFATHSFFQKRGFYYLNSPIITCSDCEGAGQMFRVTTLDPADPPRDDDGRVDDGEDFFGEPASLTVSGQLEAETYACALSKVYTFGPTFRAENSNTSRHLAEFWMVEPEVAFADLSDNVALAVTYLKHLLATVLRDHPEDMAFFNKRIAPGITDTLAGIVETPFLSIPYAEALEVLEKSGETFEFPVKWGTDLQSEHERYLTEKAFKQPLVVIDFPRQIKPFYMRVNDDGKTVAAMDVLLPGIGEIVGGSQREDRLDVLHARMAELGLDAAPYWWYLDLRRFGTVPHSGFGLGFERLVQFVTGMANIRDVIPFPRTPKNAKF